MWCNGGSVGVWGWMMMSAFWVGAIALIVWVVRTRSGSHDSPGGGPLRVLNQRLAAGEITPDEYQERRRLLEPR